MSTEDCGTLGEEVRGIMRKGSNMTITVLSGIALLASLAGCGTATTTTAATSPAVSTPSLTRFDKAVAACALQPDTLADSGKTLTLDGEGKKHVGLPIKDIACALTELKQPSSGAQKMDRTTSLMGVQEDTWDGIEASWTYHPDNGLNIILVDKS